MFGLFKRTKEFYHLGNTFDLVYQVLMDLIPKVQHASDKSEHNEAVLSLAYACKAGINNRLDKYEWPLHSGIYVPSISKSNVTIFVAISKTVAVVEALARSMDLHDEVTQIMDGGELYRMFDRMVPRVFKDKIGL